MKCNPKLYEDAFLTYMRCKKKIYHIILSNLLFISWCIALRTSIANFSQNISCNFSMMDGQYGLVRITK